MAGYSGAWRKFYCSKKQVPGYSPPCRNFYCNTAAYFIILCYGIQHGQRPKTGFIYSSLLCFWSVLIYFLDIVLSWEKMIQMWRVKGVFCPYVHQTVMGYWYTIFSRHCQKNYTLSQLVWLEPTDQMQMRLLCAGTEYKKIQTDILDCSVKGVNSKNLQFTCRFFFFFFLPLMY